MHFKETTVGRLKEGDRIALDVQGTLKSTIVTKKMKGTRDYMLCFEKVNGLTASFMCVEGSTPVMKLNKGWDVKEEGGKIIYFER